MLQWAKVNLFGAPVLDHDPTDKPFSSLTSLFDFSRRKLLESGGYGKVYKITRRTTGETYALKEVPIQSMNNPDLARNIQRERIALKRFDSPFIIKLYNTYQTADTVYFLLDFASEGDLFDQIAKHKKPLKLACVRFVAAELLMALEYLRSQNFIHRDIKAENILIDCNFHSKLSDFGNAKMIGQSQGTSLVAAVLEKNSATGTPNLVAPEVWYRDDVSFGTDYWGLGFLIFQMYTRKYLAEFARGTKAGDYFEFVEHQHWHYPFDQPDPELHDLVSEVTRHRPEDRIGTNDISELKDHPFFQPVDLDHLQHSVPPGFIMTDDDCVGLCEACDVPPMNLPPPPPPRQIPSPSSLALLTSDSSITGTTWPGGASHAVQGPGRDTPSSRGSSPSYHSAKGSLGHPSPVKNITQSLNDLWQQTTPPPRTAPPLPSSAPAVPRRNLFAVLGPAAHTPPSMSLTAGWPAMHGRDSPSSRASSSSYHSAEGSLGQQSPVKYITQSLDDIWQRVTSPPPDPAAPQARSASDPN